MTVSESLAWRRYQRLEQICRQLECRIAALPAGSRERNAIIDQLERVRADQQRALGQDLGLPE